MGIIQFLLGVQLPIHFHPYPTPLAFMSAQAPLRSCPRCNCKSFIVKHWVEKLQPCFFSLIHCGATFMLNYEGTTMVMVEFAL